MTLLRSHLTSPKGSICNCVYIRDVPYKICYLFISVCFVATFVLQMMHTLGVICEQQVDA